MIAPEIRTAIYQLHLAKMSIREIARRLKVSRKTVTAIIRQKGFTPRRVRKDKIAIDPNALLRIHEESGGQAREVRRRLLEHEGVRVSYPTLTRNLRALGLRCPRSKPEEQAAAERWFTDIVHGKVSLDTLQEELNDCDDFDALLDFARNGRRRQRKKALAILARKRGISNTSIARVLHSSRRTTRKYFTTYHQQGMSVLFGPNPTRSEVRIGHAKKKPRILEILHHKPSHFGINRTTWTQGTIIDAYQTQYNETLSRTVLTRILKDTGYSWKKARRILTSPDPDYHEKVERLLGILQSLTEQEMFFFIDEWGPVQVKKRGGRAYRRENDAPPIPRKQTPKGTVTLVGALSATTNQVTWLFEQNKDTRSIINLLEILYNQHQTRSKLYITWDAVSWHDSIELTHWLDCFNFQSRNDSTGPIIEFVPLPTSSQFLNVIEGVLNAMTKAVIHNSDYQSTDDMKSAISRHFRERNAYFRDNPRRAGNKIWDPDFFKEHDSLRFESYGNAKQP